MDSEYNPPKSPTHKQTENQIRIKHTITNPNFFVINRNSNDYITNHKKNTIFFLLNATSKNFLTMIL